MLFRQKYQPQTFSDLVFADDYVKQQLQHVFDKARNPNILLDGPYGSGKTTLAKMLVLSRVDHQEIYANALYWHAASMEKGFLSKSKAFGCSYRIFNCRQHDHVYALIDEVDQLSVANQQALRAFIDDMSSYCSLIMTTNHVGNIDGGIVNRCEKFHIGHPTNSDWIPRIKEICRLEGVSISNDELRKVLTQNHINARDVVTIAEKLVLRAQSNTDVQK